MKREIFLEEFLLPWLRIPSISPDITHKDDMKRAASFVSLYLQKLNFSVEIFETIGNQVVFASRTFDPSLPTVLFYGHYDVQPIHEPDNWVLNGVRVDPFGANILNDRIYCRGAADDKGQLGALIYALLDLQKPKYNIKIVIEGNEENGSEVFATFVAQHTDLLACDIACVLDSDCKKIGEACLTTQLRGLALAKVTGEPRNVLHTISSSHDIVSNKSNIDFFYDDITPKRCEGKFDITDAFVREIPDYSLYEQTTVLPSNSPLTIRYSSIGEGKIKLIVKGTRTLHSGKYGGPILEPGMVMAQVLDRLTCNIVSYEYGLPTVSTAIRHEAVAILSDFSQAEFDDIVFKLQLPRTMFVIEEGNFPVQKSENAFAYMSFRTVPKQDPAKIFLGLKKIVDSTHCEMKILDAAPWFETNMTPMVEKFIPDADVKMSGGTIPICPVIKDKLGVEVVLTGFSTCSDNIHGPLENYSLEALFYGADVLRRALDDI